MVGADSLLTLFINLPRYEPIIIFKQFFVVLGLYGGNICKYKITCNKRLIWFNLALEKTWIPLAHLI